MLKGIQSTLPNKTRKGQDLTTPGRHTEHQLFTLKEESPEVQFRGRSGSHDRTSNKGRKQHVNRKLVNKEEIIDKGPGHDQGGQNYFANLAIQRGTPAYSTAQNSQSIFLGGQM